MPDKVYNSDLERKAMQANKWWEALPEIIRVAMGTIVGGLSSCFTA